VNRPYENEREEMVKPHGFANENLIEKPLIPFR
jgi:hypothetical protein